MRATVKHPSPESGRSCLWQWLTEQTRGSGWSRSVCGSTDGTTAPVWFHAFVTRATPLWRQWFRHRIVCRSSLGLRGPAVHPPDTVLTQRLLGVGGDEAALLAHGHGGRVDRSTCRETKTTPTASCVNSRGHTPRVSVRPASFGSRGTARRDRCRRPRAHRGVASAGELAVTLSGASASQRLRHSPSAESTAERSSPFSVSA
jgi:hypothetical protein